LFPLDSVTNLEEIQGCEALNFLFSSPNKARPSKAGFAFVVLASPQFVRRITANRSPQSGQPAKFLLIRRESLTNAPE
jgi:hypothetical protein